MMVGVEFARAAMLVKLDYFVLAVTVAKKL